MRAVLTIVAVFVIIGLSIVGAIAPNYPDPSYKAIPVAWAFGFLGGLIVGIIFSVYAWYTGKG